MLNSHRVFGFDLVQDFPVSDVVVVSRLVIEIVFVVEATGDVPADESLVVVSYG